MQGVQEGQSTTPISESCSSPGRSEQADRPQDFLCFSNFMFGASRWHETALLRQDADDGRKSDVLPEANPGDVAQSIRAKQVGRLRDGEAV